MKQAFRVFIERNRWLKGVPNTLTICNSLCGFVAILYTLYVYDNSPMEPEQVLAVSCWIILGAMLFDALDGFAARLFNAASMHGLQMDSLSDMVTFGVAPAVVMAVMAHSLRSLDLRSLQYLVVWGFCSIYLGCAAFRLATYNVHAIENRPCGDKFCGLPSPGAAAALASLVIYFSGKEGELRQMVGFLPGYAAFLGLLMVSKVPYHHMGKWLPSIRRNNKRLFAVIMLLVFFCLNPLLAIMVAINGYVLSGPILALLASLGVLNGQRKRMSSERDSG